MALWSWCRVSRPPLWGGGELPLPDLSSSLSLSHSRVGSLGVGNLLQDGEAAGEFSLLWGPQGPAREPGTRRVG